MDTSCTRNLVHTWYSNYDINSIICHKASPTPNVSKTKGMSGHFDTKKLDDKSSNETSMARPMIIVVSIESVRMHGWICIPTAIPFFCGWSRNTKNTHRKGETDRIYLKKYKFINVTMPYASKPIQFGNGFLLNGYSIATERQQECR